MHDPAFLRDTATTAIAARGRIGAALASSDAAELYCCGGNAGAAVIATIRAETYLALAADQLHRAARLSLAAETDPALMVEPVPDLVAIPLAVSGREAR